MKKLWNHGGHIAFRLGISRKQVIPMTDFLIQFATSKIKVKIICHFKSINIGTLGTEHVTGVLLLGVRLMQLYNDKIDPLCFISQSTFHCGKTKHSSVEDTVFIEAAILESKL